MAGGASHAHTHNTHTRAPGRVCLSETACACTGGSGLALLLFPTATEPVCTMLGARDTPVQFSYAAARGTLGEALALVGQALATLVRIAAGAHCG